MIQYRPKLKNRKLINISFLLIVLSVLLFSMASLAGRYTSVVQVLSIISAAISVFLLVKYVIPDYLYTVENGHLKINKITKSQSICVADIELSDALTGILTADEYKDRNKSGKIYTYLKNPWSDGVRYMCFTNGAEEYTVQFETDAVFENNFKFILDSIKREEEENDD